MERWKGSIIMGVNTINTVAALQWNGLYYDGRDVLAMRKSTKTFNIRDSVYSFTHWGQDRRRSPVTSNVNTSRQLSIYTLKWVHGTRIINLVRWVVAMKSPCNINKSQEMYQSRE